MRPLSAIAADDAARERVATLRGLLFDLDDTVLTRGLLTREAFDALWTLRDAGVELVAVTGRPSGWGEVIARQWPSAGAITENGAIVVVRDGEGVSRRDPCSAEERRRRRVKLAQLVERVREIVPEARLSDDVDARLSDVTWDIGERVKMPVERVDAIAHAIVEAGARTTRSSVHLHASFDPDDKASGAVRFVGERFGDDAGAALARWGFVGDSGNDAACFAAFKTTFGVANVRPWLGRLPVGPRFVAERPMGAGFADVARVILEVRRRG